MQVFIYTFCDKPEAFYQKVDRMNELLTAATFTRKVKWLLPNKQTNKHKQKDQEIKSIEHHKVHLKHSRNLPIKKELIVRKYIPENQFG